MPGWAPGRFTCAFRCQAEPLPGGRGPADQIHRALAGAGWCPRPAPSLRSGAPRRGTWPPSPGSSGCPPWWGWRGPPSVLRGGQENHRRHQAAHRLCRPGQGAVAVRAGADPGLRGNATSSGSCRRLLKRIAPLNLIDPQANDFTPEGCTSVHDVIRFIHEKAVNELMDLPQVHEALPGGPDLHPGPPRCPWA